MHTEPQHEWVHVRDEPDHRHRFENDFVRVYDVRIQPGGRTLYHRHEEDTLYVALHPTHFREKRWGEDEEFHDSKIPAGTTLCRLHRSEPLTHVVQNMGTGLMRMIGAEVKKTPPVTAQAPLEAPGHVLHPQQPSTSRIRLYHIELSSGQSTGNIRYGFSGLTIFSTEVNLRLEDAQGPKRTFAGSAGDTLWHDGPQEFCVVNVGPQPVHAVLAEWR